MPGSIEMNILNEYISLEAARRDYGVIWDGSKKMVDIDATEKLRDELRDKRADIYIDQATEPYARTVKRILSYAEAKAEKLP